MELITGLSVLFVGVGVAWTGEPGRLQWRLPPYATRLVALSTIALSAFWFIGSSGVLVGVIQLLLGLSLVASVIALAAPLLPRVAALATVCMALLAGALALELLS